MELFQAVSRDKGESEWHVLHTGSPLECRTHIVAEAGFMAKWGYAVKGMNRSEITVVDEAEPTRGTTFRIRKAPTHDCASHAKREGENWVCQIDGNSWEAME